MKKLLPLLLVLLLAGAAYTGWVLLRAGGNSERQALAPGDLPEPAAPSVDESPSLVAPQAAPEAREEVAIPAPTKSTPKSNAREPGPSAIWVEGRVVFPPDTPLDEMAFVIAKGKRLGGKKSDREYRALVGQDGSFRVAFGKGTKKARVTLEARYLKLEESKKFKPNGDEELLLEPTLGGRIVVHFDRADGQPWTTEDTEGLELVVRDETSDFWQTSRGRRVRLADGTQELDLFEYGGANPSAGHSLSTTSPQFVSEEIDEVVVLAGETEEVKLSLRVGARLKGRVVDPDGKGIAKAQIRADFKTEDSSSADFITCDEEGVFDKGGLEPAETKLIVKADGFTDEEVEVGLLTLGQVVDELMIELGRGQSISGRVLWPDGSAVSGASVRMEELDSDKEWWDSDATLIAKTNAKGDFMLTGLEGSEVYRVYTRARRTKDVDVEGLSKLQRKRALKDAPYWNAQIDEVRSGTAELVLTLQSGARFVGTVVDTTGAPLEDFRVSARPADDERVLFTGKGGEVLTRTFKGAAGHFELEGLKEGSWEVSVRQRGYGPSLAVTARVPSGPLTGTFTLARDGVIRGRVLDPDGKPVPKAKVESELTGGGQFFNFRGGSDGDASTRTDADGRFELKGVGAGVVQITAKGTSNAHVTSEMQEVELAPASELEDVVLTLRRAAQVVVQVHPSLLGKADLQVNINEQSGPHWSNETPNEEGLCTFHGLSPATYALTLEIPAEEVGSENLPDQFMTKDRRRLEVTVAEGEHREVVLGEPASVTYAVFGTVSRGGVPLEGASLQIETHQDMRSYRAQSASGGSFSVPVESTGTLTLTVLVPGSKHSVRFQRQLQPNTEEAFALDIPTGGIRGVVLNSAGEPAAECSVSLQATDAKSAEGGPVHNMPVETDQQGAFEFIGLADGEYSLEASEDRQGWWGDDASDLADAPGRLFGVKVSSESEGPVAVEIQLFEGSTLKGIVTRVGDKSPQGFLVCRMTENDQIDWTTVARVRGGGSYELEGLPEGKVKIGVRDREGNQTVREVHIYLGQENVLDISVE